MWRRTAPHLPFLLKGPLPQLQRLSIGHFTAWPLKQFVNLVSISLAFNKDARDSISFMFLLQVLDRSPLLEELKLRHAGFTSTHYIGTSIVTLRCLKTLLIDDFHSPILLSHLSLPPNVIVIAVVETESNNHNVSGIQAILPVDLNNLPFVHNIVAADMVCKSRDTGSITLTATNKHGGSLSATERIARRLARSPRSYYKSYLDSLPTLDLSQLTDLRLIWGPWDEGGGDSLPRNIALYMFESMPALRNLVIADHAMVDFLRPLLSDQGSICPLLESLEVSVRTGAHPEVFSILFSIARSRSLGGYPLRRISPIFSGSHPAEAITAKEAWKKWYKDYHLDEFLCKSDDVE